MLFFFFDNARASCPRPIHVVVFVLTSFFVVFGRFVRAFVSFVLETAWFVLTTCRGFSSLSLFLLASRMVSSFVTCTITSLLFVAPLRTVIERSVHHQSLDAVDDELCIGALVVHSAPPVVLAGCRRLVGSCQISSKEGARQAQVHFLSFSTSLVCLIATADLLYEFGHVAENSVDFQCDQFFTQYRRLKSVALA